MSTKTYSRVVPYLLVQGSSACNTSETYTYMSPTYTNTRTGSPLPGWKNIIRAGGNATTGLTASSFFVDRAEPGSGYVTYKSLVPIEPCKAYSSQNYVRGYVTYPSVHSAFGGTESEADNKAKMQAYRAISATYRQWQGGVFFGELLQTARMIISPAKSLRNMVGKYMLTLKNKKRKVTKAQWSRVVADEWLEINFGLRPLLDDVKGLAETIARYGDSDQLKRTRVRGFGKSERLVSYSTITNGFINGLYYNQYERTIGRTMVIYRVGLRHQPSGPFDAARKLAQLSGLTPENWVPTAWELLPWSFVVDYFLNIGDILSASWTDTSSVSWVCKTVVIEGERDCKTVIDHQKTMTNTGSSYSDSGGSSLGSYRSFARSVNRGNGILSPPELTLRVPGVSSVQWLNLAALKAQMNDLNRTSFYRR